MPLKWTLMRKFLRVAGHSGQGWTHPWCQRRTLRSLKVRRPTVSSTSASFIIGIISLDAICKTYSQLSFHLGCHVKVSGLAWHCIMTRNRHRGDRETGSNMRRRGRHNHVRCTALDIMTISLDCFQLTWRELHLLHNTTADTYQGHPKLFKIHPLNADIN
jgi:hypothetical protein